MININDTNLSMTEMFSFSPLYLNTYIILLRMFIHGTCCCSRTYILLLVINWCICNSRSVRHYCKADFSINSLIKEAIFHCSCSFYQINSIPKWHSFCLIFHCCCKWSYCMDAVGIPYILVLVLCLYPFNLWYLMYPSVNYNTDNSLDVFMWV